ncbi:hypothetical protein ACFU8R_23985, partial [Pseudonocardia alni]|uniref:hypothetical protein n=2 Tax=Pseudonocardiaceae TaxID=2070 RepID=UPI00368F90AA
GVMVERVLLPGEARAEAAAVLLQRLEDLVVAYAGVPEADRRERLEADADRITGEVARHLQAARSQVTPPRPRPRSGRA